MLRGATEGNSGESDPDVAEGAFGHRYPESPTIAEVAPEVPTAGGDGLYDYRVPPGLIGLVRPGCRLVIPLGGRPVEGVCVRLKAEADVGLDRLKDILTVLDQRPVYPESSLDLALWTARRYLCQPGEVLRAARPAPVKAREGRKRRTGPSERPGAAEAPAAAGSDAAAATVTGGGSDAPAVSLSAAQKAALEALGDALRESAAGPARSADAGRPRVFLLHGVTGSGKTEVYLRAAAQTVAAGRQVLLLVPEVSLVPQTLQRVRAYLGAARVAVNHSYLAGAERIGYWERVAAGEADVVVGARSTVFAPLDRLGLIILDEEHEDAYKQEEGAPRYHARDVAVRRALKENAVLILASATPSLESYRRALEGRYALLNLPERAAGRSVPRVEVVDMRAELAQGNRSLFSRALQAELDRTVAAGRQAILFLNRRGHSTFVLCRDCGWVARCPGCDVSLTYHEAGADLRCHYCGYRAPPPDRCPGCGGHRVRYFGAGTQRVEQEVRLRHPTARVVRLDADVVRRPGEAARVLALFEAGQADILVGTQMVAKGLDVPGVELVAAVAADTALHLPDFRASEKTFRLLVQAAGRAGRGWDPGRVIIQTYNPDHPAVTAAARQDYASFAQAELKTRRSLGYPPWSHLVRIVVTDPEESKGREVAAAVAEALADLGFSGSPGSAAGGEEPARFAGPAPAPLARLQGRWRWHVLVFCHELEEGLQDVGLAVQRATRRPARGGGRRRRDGPEVSVDVDPVSVL